MRLKKKKLLGIILSLVLALGLMPGMTITANATGTTYKILEVDGVSSRVIAESVTLPYATTVNAFRNSWDQENQHIKSVPTCNSGTESVVTVGAQSGTLGQSGCDFALTINNAGSEELSFEVLWDDSTYTEDIGLAVIANTDHEGTTNGCGWKYTYATKTLDILSGTPARLFETYDDYLLKNLEITTINIADSVTGIGDEAFDSSNGLASVNISADSSITSIGQWAFSNCSGLTSITIPAGVTSIADNAFNNCPNIADVYCYAAPSTLSWTTSNTYTNFKENKATVCHVKQSDLEEWKAKANLNLTFVGDLKSNPVAIAPTATATYGQTLADVTLTNPTGNTEGTWAWVDATTTSVGTVGEHTFKANFTPTDSTNYNSVSNVDVTVTVAKANSVVTAAPTAKNLKYNGSAQELVTAGTVEGGTMQYALGTKDAATEEYTESIPTATNAGTYYVWYKVVGDDNLNNSEAEKVTVTISQLSIKNATVSLDKTDLVYTGSEQSVQVSSVKIGETVLKANSDYEVSGTTGTNKGDYTVTVTGKGNYKDVVTSKWNIAMATPVIDVLPSASAITYGQSLADSTLTEGTAKLGENVVEGTFSWKNDATKPVVSDSEKTEYVVVFTPNDADNLNTVECKVKVTVNKAIAGVAKAPTANTLIYNGKAQVLVKAGEATDGIMNYAIGKDDKTAPAEGWNTSIPTATGAGTYYVWYKVVGDSNHLDSDAGYVTVTIAPADSSDSGSGSTSSGSTDSGSGDSSGDSSDNTNTDTDTSAKVPYEDVAISTGSVKDITGTAAATAEINPFGTKIENNSNLTTLLSLTDAEVAQGVNVWLDVQDMSASVPQTDKTLIQNTSGDYTVGLYLDINLFKKVGSNDATKVTETKGKVKASIVIPESLWKSGRTFEIIRVHDGVATAIAGTYDENTHVFTFETDKFSTYALAYKDPASSSNSGTTSNSSSSNGSNSIQATAPKTGDSNDIRVWYLLLMASLGGLGFIGYSKKKEK